VRRTATAEIVRGVLQAVSPREGRSNSPHGGREVRLDVGRRVRESALIARRQRLIDDQNNEARDVRLGHCGPNHDL
jgi:hypothetical protein